MTFRLTPYRVTVVTLIGLLFVAVMGNSFSPMVTDIKPEIYFAPGKMVERYLSSWMPTPYLGHPNFNVGLVPVAASLAPLELLGLPPEAIFGVFHFSLWLMGGWGAARTLRLLNPGVSRWATLGAGVLYVANPYSVVGGSTLAILLPHAFLPWLIWCMIRSVQKPRSWRWPAGVGLAFFAMSGMNAAVVPLFLLLSAPIFAIVVGRTSGRSWADILRALLRPAIFVVLVSAYWLVPSVTAAHTGLTVVAESETIEGIARVSSAVEVLRGMGMWTLYGFDGSGPWIPEFQQYISNPVMVLMSAVWPVLGLLALAGASKLVRRVTAVTIVSALVVMVGFFPGRITTPLGWGVARALDVIPTLGAFRTTNKAGSLLAIAFALVIADATGRWLIRLSRARAARGVVITVGVSLVLSWVHPALVGNLYTSPIEIPAYWESAAAAVEGQGDSGRILFLPTQVRASYRWTEERPDDLANVLLSREAIVTQTSPSATTPGANFLAATGDLAATAAPGSSVVSAMARYLGADDVLLRHDLRWESWNGPRPQQSAELLGADPGLLGVANFGEPGENVEGPAGVTWFESVLPPLQLYGVRDPEPTVSVRQFDGAVTLAGDAWAFDGMARLGLLAVSPPVWYAADLDSELFSQRLGSQSRLVLSDTNQRRAAITNRVLAGYGPLLRPSESPSVSRMLGLPDDQTILLRSGPEVIASQVGSAFFDVPYGQPDNALDGDEMTSWLFGDFHRAPGATLTVKFAQPQRFDVVPIQTKTFGAVRIDEVSMTAGGTTRTATVPPDGRAEVDLGGVESDTFTLRVQSVQGDGFSLVGVSELGLPGEKVARIARLPKTLDRLYEQLDDASKSVFSGTPLDIVLTRVSNGPPDDDDSESTLARDFSLPDPRTFQGSASIRISRWGEDIWDRLQGHQGQVTATSSSRLFGSPEVRASKALDEDPNTGWMPDGDPVGSWWQVTVPTRELSQIVLTQDSSTPERVVAEATSVAVEVDGRRVSAAKLQGGRNVISLPVGTEGAQVRIIILGVEQPAGEGSYPPRFTSIEVEDLPGYGPAVVPEEGPGACVTVATLNGRALKMRPADGAALIRDPAQAHDWVSCGLVSLEAGQHQLRPVSETVVDTLDLQDASGAEITITNEISSADVSGSSLTSYNISMSASTDRTVLKLGQSYDPRWRATIDGVDAGPPTIVDGWSIGWIIDGPGQHTVKVWYGPQRIAFVALLISLATLLGSVVLVARRERPESPGAHRAKTAAVIRDMNWRARPLFFGSAGVLLVLGFGLPGGIALVIFWLIVVIIRRMVGLLPTRVAQRRCGVLFGAVLVLIATILQIWLVRDAWGALDSAMPSRSMWPHWIAVSGVVIAVLGAVFDIAENRPPKEHDASVS